MRVVPLALFCLSLSACRSDIGVVKSARCNGILEPNEDYVDSPFDRDGDGYYDGNNTECAEFYPAELLDCDDGDAEAHPNQSEVLCNDVDDDCDATTPDSEDLDDDRFLSCEDCDDADPSVNPSQAEVACNSIDDDCDSTTVDGPDADSDGYTACIDCDDARSAINPGETEVECNGLDDDCNTFTGDGADFDEDGYTVCDDCDDSEAEINPGFEEVCDNEIDDDCDDEIDEDCAWDYTDTWDLDTTVSYSCAFGTVTINFHKVLIIDDHPAISVSSTGSGSQPGTMEGTFTTATTFSAKRVLTGTCTEKYVVDGTFLDENTFEGTFQAIYTGSACFDCSTQSWTITGSR